jgi:hypothetical protein
MGMSYLGWSEAEIREHKREAREARLVVENLIANKRRELAAKIIMVTVDRIVAQIIRPGPKPEERECYVMAGELRAIVPDLEELAKQVIDVNDGVE